MATTKTHGKTPPNINKDQIKTKTKHKPNSKNEQRPKIQKDRRSLKTRYIREYEKQRPTINKDDI